MRARFQAMYLPRSSEIWPQIKEFDRLSTTVVNSYVGPVFGEYLRHLKERFAALAPLHDVLIMQSNGGGAAGCDAKSPWGAGHLFWAAAGGGGGGGVRGKVWRWQ